MRMSLRTKAAIAAGITVVAVAGAAGAWWLKHRATPQGAGGDVITAPGSASGTPAAGAAFGADSCQASLFEDQPSLSVSFTEPLERDQPFDTLVQVTDLGATEKNENGNEDGNDAQAPVPLTDVAQSAPTGKVVRNTWVLQNNGRTLVFPYISAQRNFRITVSASLRSQGGASLERARECRVASADMAPTYYFASKGTVLPAGQNGGLPIVTINVPEVDVQFLRIEPAQFPQFISRIIGIKAGDSDEEEDEFYWDSGRRNRLKGNTYGWQLNQLKEMSKSVYLGRFLTDEKQNRRKVTHLPVETIAELKEPGIYVAVMSQPGRFGDNYQVTYFYVSDIGLHVRRQAKQMDVFTTSLKTGEAITGADIEVLDAEAKTIARGKVDGEGRATLAGVPDKAHVLLARRGKELSMIVLHEPGLDLSEFEIGGHLPRDAKLFLYAGRDLYRPGETFTASMLARNADGQVLPPSPITVELKKPDGDVVQSAVWQPDARTPGYFQRAIVLPADAATGRWTLEAKADPAAKRADTVWSFQVEEFLPERMKLDLKSEDAPLADDGNFAVQVRGDYLYGAPAAGNRLLASLAVERATNPLPRQWPGFIFGDFADDSAKTRRDLDETTLDDEGRAEVDIPLGLGKLQSPMKARASFSLLESGGRPVVRSLERAWWPAKTLIGIRPAFERNVTREGSMAEFEVIRTDAAGKIVPAAEAAFRLYKEDRQYYWRYDDRRGWHSGYTEGNQLLESGRLALKARAKLTLPVEWGTYRLEVTDPDTGLTARYRFYAGWGAQNADDIGNRPDRVQMKLAGVPAKPGTEVELTMLPPHDGEALVLVEADKVLWSRRVKVSTSGTTLRIPIDKSWKRSDMYVSAVVFRPGSEGDRVTPARAIGLTWLPLARDDRKLKVAITTPQRVEPEKRATARVKVEGAAGKPAFVTVSAVDVGILNITSYKTPDPFDFFFGKHRFGIELTDIYGKLIEKMDGLRGKLKWGGDAGMRDTRSMPSKVKLIDLFSGPVQLNAQGEADVPLDVPDFNGTLRIMAVAATAESFGSAEREMTVSAPIVAEIATPRFIAPGDAATLALDVTNMSGTPQQVSISLSAESPLRIAGGSRSINLKDKQREILRFTAEPTEPYGLARITLDLRTAGAKPVVIKREFALQVQPPLPREHQNQRLRIEPGASITLDRNAAERYFRGSATVSLSLSNKPPLNINSLVKGLLDYPYGCLEQTTSAAYPHLFIDEAGAKAVGLTPRTREERARFVEGAIGRIAGMQGAAGGYSLWGSNGSYEYWLTAYVSGFLMDARDAGFNVPAAMHKNAQDWMLDKLNNAGNYLPGVPDAILASNGANRPHDYELLRNGHQRFAEMAHIGYMLAREQKAPLAVLRLLHDNHRRLARSPLPLVHLSLALRLMGDAKRADEALNEAMQRPYGIATNRGNYWGEWLGDYGSSVRDNALAYALLNRHEVQHPQRENLLTTVAERLGERQWYSTQERLALFLAARAAGGDASTPWQAELKSAAGTRPLTSASTLSQELQPADLSRGITVENKGPQAIYAELEASGFPLKPPAARSDVIEISRSWHTVDGKRWGGGPLKVGDMLIARVTVKAKQHVEDGLIVDHIPAGLEVENLNLSQGPQAGDFSIDNVNVGEAMKSGNIKHTEYRDDRFVTAAKLPFGESRFFYLLRVVTPGKFSVPAPYAEDMYRPEIRGIGVTPEPVSIVDPRQ
ncbi:alpha-2-macroglobulin family protein [Uliginosibacterium sp. H1]|uniref:alpha-2-macroglobulin family protein n=1 Tax=Uliginosibacterium sp. H1 TaxID=3114757 RepID=UPI002E173ACA|nr:alpha-2-macroglobulin [Uliginosibacterium sp. H1]